MQRIDAVKKLCSYLDIKYDNLAYNGSFSEEYLIGEIQDAQSRAWSLHTWTLGEGIVSITNTSAGSYDNPSNILPNSQRRLIVSDIPWQNISYTAYLDYLAEKTNDTVDQTKKYWSVSGNTIFLNPDGYEATDTLQVFGQYTVSDLPTDADTLFFRDEIGNVGIVQLAYANILASGKKKDAGNGQYQEQEALSKINRIWQRNAGGKVSEETKKNVIGYTNWLQ